jgi:hypothetical protein
MSHDGSAEPTPTEATAPQESIDAFLDREFATALAVELAKAQLPQSVHQALIEVSKSPAPDKKAWLDAVDPPAKAPANG